MGMDVIDMVEGELEVVLIDRATELVLASVCARSTIGEPRIAL